jgi:hypothetical protein
MGLTAPTSVHRDDGRLNVARRGERDARFSADNRDPVPETLLPQGYGGVASGHGRADDHDSGPVGTRRHLTDLPGPPAAGNPRLAGGVRMASALPRQNRGLALEAAEEGGGSLTRPCSPG